MKFLKKLFKHKKHDLSTPEKIIARFEKVALDLQLSVFGFKNKRRRKELDQLAALGANPDVREPNGNNTLMLAVKHEHPELAKAILRHGGDPRALNLSGKTALHMAYKTRVPDIIHPLINDGADVNAVNHDGRRPHDYALNLFDHSLLQIAAGTPGVEWLHLPEQTHITDESALSTQHEGTSTADTLSPSLYMEHYLAHEWEQLFSEQAGPQEHHPSAPPPDRHMAERLILPQYVTELAKAEITKCPPVLIKAIHKDPLTLAKVKTALTSCPHPASEPLLNHILPETTTTRDEVSLQLACRPTTLRELLQSERGEHHPIPDEVSLQLARRPTTFYELLQAERAPADLIQRKSAPQTNGLAHRRSRRA